jgi:8-oxo-dGTP diphosphatase
MAEDPERADVKAAGGVVRRDDRVAAAHRPRYDDWSLPKGKLNPGESWEDAARREVHEELGLCCRLREELPVVFYDVAAGRKAVRFWVMEVESGAFAPNKEVDEMRWVNLDEAERLLSYEHDRELARRVLA